MNANLLKLSPAERAAKLLAFRPGAHNFTMSRTPQQTNSPRYWRNEIGTSIVSIDTIKKQARQAARSTVDGKPVTNPYTAVDCDVAAAWAEAYEQAMCELGCFV